MAWPKNGTIDVTNNSETVTGTGTTFRTSKVKPGNEIIIDGVGYEIASVESNTSLTLASPYAGATASSLAYVIKPIAGMDRDILESVVDLTDSFGEIRLHVDDLTGIIVAVRDDKTAAENAASSAATTLQTINTKATQVETNRSIAEQAKNTAVTKASEATSARDTAVTKAGEASASASKAQGHELAASGSATDAANSALTAGGYANTAQQHMLDAQDAADRAETAATNLEVVFTRDNITTGLGYVPYNATNPDGYISTVTNSMVTNALGFSPVSSVNSKTGAVTLTKADLGLGNVENKSSATIRGELTSANVTTALGYTPASAAGGTFTGSIILNNNSLKTQYNATDRLTISSDGSWNTFTGINNNGHRFTTAGGGNLSLANDGTLTLGGLRITPTRTGLTDLNSDGAEQNTVLPWVSGYQPTNRPPGNWSAGITLSMNVAGYANQIAATSSGTEPALYTRSSGAGTWGPWRNLWHSGNFDPVQYVGPSTHQYCANQITTAKSGYFGLLHGTDNGHVASMFGSSMNGGWYVRDTGNGGAKWLLYTNGTDLFVGSSNSNKVWHTGNLNPASYAPLSGAAFTGAVSGTLMRLNPAGAGNYNEGIRIAASTGGFAGIHLGTSASASEGTQDGQWGILRRTDGTLSFRHNTSDRMYLAKNGAAFFGGSLYINNQLVMDQAGNQTWHYGGSSGFVFRNAANTATTASLSNDGAFTATESHSAGWFRNSGSGGLYFSSYARGLYAPDAAGTQYGNVNVYGSGRNGWAGYAISNQSIYMANGSQHGIYNQTAGHWAVQFDNSGNATFPANITAYSDERIKDNIRTIDDAREIVRELTGIRYERDGKTRVGLGAQTTRKVLPEVVNEADDIVKKLSPEKVGTLSVNYGDVVGVLVEAQKSVDADVVELQAEVASLKELVAKQAALIEQLSKRLD